MRPVRLEVEGFGPFHQRTELSFDGVDLFALTGPTGAGKTSVIDAMTFALYGSVPRLADQRAVAPVVTQGLVECKVRLDFTVGDGAYTAVRVVRATKTGGATTREARLARADGELLAGDADAVSVAVTELLGLDYRQFTTCVSLPQGDFARFLHDKPRDRQDLLVRLLDLGLYEAVRAAANQRSALAAERARLGEARLADLAWATVEGRATATARVVELTVLRGEIEKAEPELAALRAEAAAADDAALVAARALALLDGVVVPAGVDAVAADLLAATTALTQADKAETAAVDAHDRATAALAAQPARGPLEKVAEARLDRADLDAVVEKGEAAVVGSRATAEGAAAALVDAELAAREANDAVGAARTAHLAHALAADLVVGEPCPVCRHAVTEVPTAKPADVKSAERRLATTAKAVDGARAEAATANAELVRVEEKLVAVLARRDELDATLATAPTAEEVIALFAAIAGAEAEVITSRAAVAGARQARITAAARVERATAVEREARLGFDAARDRLATLDPPPAARVDLASDWTALAAWVGARRPTLETDQGEARSRAATARTSEAAVIETLDARCRALAVEPGRSARDAVVAAAAHAENQVRSIGDALETAVKVKAEIGADVEERDVAKALAGHLAANNFEQWLLDEVLQQLVVAATVRLRELSGGAYSLVLDPKSRTFAVIDHVNADAIRSARTLSGGETFLASLALALALAEQVATFAAAGAARLETILLDEGFGTLDPETLEVVATALEELGASGRMVGVVTHVRELADRLPVRYEITKVGGAATVERIDT